MIIITYFFCLLLVLINKLSTFFYLKSLFGCRNFCYFKNTFYEGKLFALSQKYEYFLTYPHTLKKLLYKNVTKLFSFSFLKKDIYSRLSSKIYFILVLNTFLENTCVFNAINYFKISNCNIIEFIFKL